MSKRGLKESEKLTLMGRAAGRCELCGNKIYEDSIQKSCLNISQYAHIVADSSNGPRGSEESDNLATDINNVMYAYIDRKKKLPVTTLLRAIGFEQDKDILQIFDLAEEVKVNKKNMKDAIGRRLAARVLKSWNEDFVDEDTGEVVSIERNEVIMERETEITKDNINDILDSGASSVLLHKDEEMANKYAIIFNTLAKDPSNSEKEAVLYIYRQLRNADPADDASAREVIQNLFFSDKRYDLGEVGRYRINKKLGIETDSEIRILTKEEVLLISSE